MSDDRSRAFDRRRFALALIAATATGCATVRHGPAVPPAPPIAASTTEPAADGRPDGDPALRRAQANPTELSREPATDLPALTDTPIGPAPAPAPDPTIPGASAIGGQSIGLETALYGALTQNPELVALRQNAPATAEAVEVARRFPTALNPTLFVDLRPFNYARDPRPGLNQKDVFVNVSIRQPIELGHQTTHRLGIAQAAYNQARWGIVQAEILALVQTYRFFQTAAYRREKLALADRLAGFNDKLVASLNRAFEEGLVQPADLRLAEVEGTALQQQAEAARQDYAIALADLRNQLGIPETAGASEPLGAFALPAYIAPLADDRLVALALRDRPEIHAARAVVEGARSAVRLAQADRIPTIVAGPEYQSDQNGTQYFGVVAFVPLPVLNDGTPLVLQREAERRRACVALRQAEQRTATQVRAAVAKWNAVQRLVAQTDSAAAGLKSQEAGLEALFQENQIDLARLLQARQRLIQLENARLDATWQATQAQADLLTAIGAHDLLAMSRSLGDAGRPPAPGR